MLVILHFIALQLHFRLKIQVLRAKFPAHQLDPQFKPLVISLVGFLLWQILG